MPLIPPPSVFISPPAVQPGFVRVSGAVRGEDFEPSGLPGASAPSRYVGATTTGAPVVGTFAVGDFVLAHDGPVWVCTVAGTPGTWTAVGGSSAAGAISFVIFGDGTTIAPGIAGDLVVPFACTISSAEMLADRTTDAVVAIWKSAYAGFPPTVANIITGADPLTLTSAIKMQDLALTGWTTAISAGDILRFNTNSCSAAQRLLISLQVTG